MTKIKSGQNEKEYEKNDFLASVGGFFAELIKIFIFAAIIVIPIRVFLFQPFFVQGASMEPNFEDGEYLIVNEFGYKKTDLGITTIKPFKKLKRGEVVVFRYPKNEQLFFIKRVIGLPGERIKIDGGKVYIFNKKHPDGFELKETYLPKNLKTVGEINYFIKNNEYFVMGDNRMHSSDSRIWGPVPEFDVIGRVVFRAWPPNRITFFAK